MHEILHLTIHSLITKYNVSHWQKERIVDLLMMKIIPRLSKSQQIVIDIGEIDKIFDDNYPHVEDAIKKIGSLR